MFVEGNVSLFGSSGSSICSLPMSSVACLIGDQNHLFSLSPLYGKGFFYETHFESLRKNHPNSPFDHISVENPGPDYEDKFWKESMLKIDPVTIKEVHEEHDVWDGISFKGSILKKKEEDHENAKIDLLEVKKLSLRERISDGQCLGFGLSVALGHQSSMKDNNVQSYVTDLIFERRNDCKLEVVLPSAFTSATVPSLATTSVPAAIPTTTTAHMNTRARSSKSTESSEITAATSTRSEKTVAPKSLKKSISTSTPEVTTTATVPPKKKPTKLALYHLDQNNRISFSEEEAKKASDFLISKDLENRVKASLQKQRFNLPQEKEKINLHFCNEAVYGKLNLLWVCGLIRLEEKEPKNSDSLFNDNNDIIHTRGKDELEKKSIGSDDLLSKQKKSKNDTINPSVDYWPSKREKKSSEHIAINVIKLSSDWFDESLLDPEN
eukprot:Awhi_evm2s14072